MAVFDDGRKHPRLVRQISVEWSIESQVLYGEGVLLDLSATGARLQIGTVFDGRGGATFTLNSPAVPLLPTRARLRWFRRLEGRKPVVLCGVMFEQGIYEKPWADWIKVQIEEESRVRRLASLGFGKSAAR